MSNVYELKPKDPADQDSNLREARAAALACGQSFGPRGQGVDDDECTRIEARAAELNTAPALRTSETLRVDFNNAFCGAHCGVCGEGFEAAHAIHAYAGDDFGQIVCDDCAHNGGILDELLELRDVHRVTRWLNACGYGVRDELEDLRELAADWRKHHSRPFRVDKSHPLPFSHPQSIDPDNPF